MIIRIISFLFMLLLMSPMTIASDFGDFQLPEKMEKTSEILQGRLEIDFVHASVKTDILVDNIGLSSDQDSQWDRLPAFSFEFIQSGFDIIPTVFGAIKNDHPNWEWVLAPGKIWRYENRSRLSIPIALMEKNENCIHNGVLTVDIQNGKAVSEASFLIAAETCSYFKFDIWGHADASWQEGDIPNANLMVQAFSREKEMRISTKTIDEFLGQYPKIDVQALSESHRISEADMTNYGVIVDGMHYVSGCGTRAGQFPHCDEMLMPSYSFAKSIFAGFALLALEKRFTGARQRFISDYVPECGGENWRNVTFSDALNMATGNYNSPEAGVDEASSGLAQLFSSKSHKDKINFSCHLFPHKEEPGSSFVYHSSDTYILGTAMNAFWKEQHGPDADLFEDLIVADIFEPLGLSMSARWSRRTDDSVRQTFTGWGLIFTRNDLAKILSFIGENNENLVPETVFDMEMFDGVRSGSSGLPTEGASTSGEPALMKYTGGFWKYNVKNKLGCVSDSYIPFMSGFGGLSAFILPGKIEYYSISDGGIHAFIEALAELDKISRVCKGGKNA